MGGVMGVRIRQSSSGKWCTNDELRFLCYIGQFNNPPSSLSRKVLLRQYASTIAGRQNWDGIEVGIIKEYLAKEIGVF
jgi:hypothetical protein